MNGQNNMNNGYNSYNNMNNGYNNQNYYNPNQEDNKEMRDAYNDVIDGKIANYHNKRNRKIRITKFIKRVITLAIVIVLAFWGYKFFTESDFIENMVNNIKKDSLVDDAVSAINVVRNEVTIRSESSNSCYNLSEINTLIQRKIINSPFKQNYSTSSYVKASLDNNGNFIYSVCLVDIAGNGINITKEENLGRESVKIGTAYQCALPIGCK